MYQNPPEPNPDFIAMPPMYRRLTTPATNFVVWSAVAVYIVQLANYFFPAIGFDPAQWLACSPEGLKSGYYWQLVTYAWIHSIDIPIHIVVNMLMVRALGGEVERICGSINFLILYLVGAIVAVLTFLAFNWSDNENIAGASGSAFCLLTVLAVLEPRRRLDVLLFFIIPMRMTILTLAFVVCGTEVAFIVFGWLPFISHSAHLGGAAFGLVGGWIMSRKVRRHPSSF